MKLILKAGTTSYVAYVSVLDSSSTTGGKLTGLAFNTASLTAYYVRPGGNATAITLATQTVTGAYSSGGFVEVSSTNMPGLYRLDIPDAVLAAGATQAVVSLKGAANMVQVDLEIQLVAFDTQDGVRLGLTALPNAAAEASGGLITRGTGTGQASVTGGRINADAVYVDGAAWATHTAGYAPADVRQYGGSAGTFAGGKPDVGAAASVTGAVGSVTGNVGGNVTGSVASVVGNVGGNVVGSVASVSGAVGSVTGSVGSVAAGGIASTSFAAGAITAAVIATDAIDSDAIAASAVTEIQSGLSTLTAAQVNTEVDTALADIHLDHLIAVADPGSVVANSSFLAKLTSKSATPAFSSFDNTTDSLEAIRDNQSAGGGATAQQVWEYASRTLTAGASITAVSPLNADTYDLELWKGDDYYTTDTGRTISWTLSGLPSITGATISFRILDGTGTAVLTKAGTVVSSTVAVVELSNTNTNLTPGAYRYDVKATLVTTSHVVTLVAGSCVIRS